MNLIQIENSPILFRLNKIFLNVIKFIFFFFEIIKFIFYYVQIYFYTIFFKELLYHFKEMYISPPEFNSVGMNNA